VQVYFISKGSLRVANKQFSNVNNDYEMTLNANSEVEEVPEDAASIQMPAMKYKFVKIDALGPYVNGRELVGMSFYIHMPRSASCFVQVKSMASSPIRLYVFLCM
jgi:replication factor A1